MEEYMKTLLEQVRCKKAHAYIEKEIRGHIEDQTEENIRNGMTREIAEKEAVRDMGDPVAAGISLDQIHKPQMAWDMIVLMAVIAIAGIIVHSIIGYNFFESGYSFNFAVYTGIGFLAMLVVYRVDYSFFGKYAKPVATVYLLGVILAEGFLGSMGTTAGYWNAGEVRSFLIYSMMLYVPLYGAILYSYYGSGYFGLLKAILWMIVPVFFAFRLPCLSLAVILLYCMAVVLSIALWKNWFHVCKNVVLITGWFLITVLPLIVAASAVAFRWLADYQIHRIQVFVNGGEGSYITNLLRSYIADSRLIGGNTGNLADTLPEFNSSYILASLSTCYGMLAGFVVCVVLAFLVFKIFRISFGQKNQLGMTMGCGCGMIFLSNIGINILENIGWFPASWTFLPFFSYGGGGVIVSYILIGIILSIYRYKNILPKHLENADRRTKNRQGFLT